MMNPMELEPKDTFKEKNLMYFEIQELDEFKDRENLLEIFLKHQEENIFKYASKAIVKYQTENSQLGEINTRITKYPRHNYTETDSFLSENSMIVAIYGILNHNEEKQFQHIQWQAASANLYISLSYAWAAGPDGFFPSIGLPYLIYIKTRRLRKFFNNTD